MNGHVVEGTWPKGSLKTGGGAPDDPMLEKRVATLEERIDRIEVKIDRIDEALRRIEAALKELASDSKELRKQVNELAVKLAAIEGETFRHFCNCCSRSSPLGRPGRRSFSLS